MKRIINIILFSILVALFIIALAILTHRHFDMLSNQSPQEKIDKNIYEIVMTVFSGLIILLAFALELFVKEKVENPFNIKCEILFRVQMAVVAVYIVLLYYVIYNIVALITVGAVLLVIVCFLDIRLIFNYKKSNRHVE